MQKLREEFGKFPKTYSLAPLWYWNDELRENELTRQLDEMRRQNVNEAMIFPMAGMHARYLSEEYFEAFRFTLREAEKRGMRIWIYDEYCWPSGVAGGIINADYPEYLMRSCRFYMYSLAKTASRSVRIELPPGRLIWAQAERRSDGRRIELFDACDDFALRWKAGSGAWDILVCVAHPIQFSLEAVTAARWSNNIPGYVDVMNKEAVAKYIELVYEGHYRAAPRYFGNVMPGFFTDEPGIGYDMRIRGGRAEIGCDGHTGFRRDLQLFTGDQRHDTSHKDNPMLHGFARSLPWTRDLLALFHERCGYDLRPRLVELVKGKAADRKVCYDYFQLISDQFAESYAEQIGAWCARHKVNYTGHYRESVNGGDYYRQVKPQQVPGIDLLGGRGAVENLIILPRRVATIARMQGRSRVMAETYGVTPWNFELAHKIQVADLLTVLGINLHAPIDYAYSLRSFRKHTAQPPGFYQSSSWAYQKKFSDHTARMCQMLSAGRSAVSVGLIYGSSAALSNSVPDPEANAHMEDELKRAFLALAHAQIETDVVHETGIYDGVCRGGRLIYPGVTYSTLVLPPITILRKDTVSLLIKFARGGGTLVILGNLPAMDPCGASLDAAWHALTGIAAAAQGDAIVDRRFGRGRWVFVPDFTRVVNISAPPASGEQSSLFDGTDSLFCVKPSYPFMMDFDLGRLRKLTSFSMTIEQLKQDIVYDYTIQLSDDGCRWKSVANLKCRGLIHKTDLRDLEARYFRLHMRSASDPKRLFGLTDLCVLYRDEKGVEQRWKPPYADTSPLPDILPGTLPTLTFMEKGVPARELLGAERVLGADRIQAVVSRSGKERLLTGKVSRGYAVELWDMDTGKTGLVPVIERKFTLTLAPYEAKLFVLRKNKTEKLPVISPDCRYTTLSESAGPWPFQPTRANALPLAATGNLKMADPIRPDKWYPSDAGRIPEALRPVSVLLFTSEIDVDWYSGREELLVEEGVFANLAVNGRPVPDSAFKVNRYYDAFGRSARIGSLLKRGCNRVTGWYMPEMYERMTQGAYYRWPILQPTLDAFILGDFAVLEGRLVKPAVQLSGQSWQSQGYPYFGGTGVYTVDLPLREKRGAVWLEIAARDGVAEVRSAGRLTGTKIAPPWLVDVTRHVKPGSNRFEIRITNTIGSLFAAVKIGSVHGVGEIVCASGLERARLVKPLPIGK